MTNKYTKLSGFLLLFFALLLSGNGYSQATVTIGTGVTTSYFYGPYYRSSAASTFNYSRYAYVYTAAELSAIPAGALITQVEWNKASGNITGNNYFEILMSNTAATTLATGTTWGTVTAGATSVYSSSTQAFTAAAPGWESFTLSAPFAYTGNSLQIMTDHVKSGTASAANNYYYSPATNQAIGIASGTALNNSSALTTTTYGNNRPNIRITYIMPSPCTGTPNAGTATISASTGCPSINFTLSASGLTYDAGTVYQWQSAPSAGGPWTNIVGANSPSYTTNATTTTYYQLVSTCTNSTLTNTTNVVSYTVVNPGPCICNTYAIVSASSTADEDLGTVTVGTMTNTTTCAQTGGAGSILNQYSNYTGSVTPASVQVGSSVAFSLSSITCGGNFGNGFQIYIDYNADGDFADPGEQAYSSPASATGPHTDAGNFTVPITATLGVTRMRVVVVETTFPTATNYATTGYTWGETEDYCIDLIAATNCAGTPTAGTAAISPSSGCPNTNFNLSATGYTVASGITFQWQTGPSAAGPWTNTAGTSPNYTTQTATTAFYQLIVTCTNSGLTDTTNVVSYTVNNPGPCVCSAYTIVSASSTADEDLGSVTVGTMTNTSTCAQTGPGAGSILNRYSNYAGSVTGPSVQQGQTVNFSLTSITCGGNFNNGFKIYVDYNQNGSFADPGEEAYSSPASVNGPHTDAGTFTVPPAATVGLTRMRIVVVETTFPNATNYATTGYTWGETEDYCITITTPPPMDIEPVAFVRPLTTGCYSASDSVIVQVTNNGTLTADFSINPLTVNVSVTGPNPMTFPPVVITSGTLASYATMNVVVATNYNMSAAGTYGFSTTTSFPADGDPSNDSYGPINFTFNAGTALAAAGGRICVNSPANVTVSGYSPSTASIQWQSSPDNIIWTNIPGQTNPTNTALASDTTFYRAVICGLLVSTVDTVFTAYVSPATTVGDTICGVGTVNLSASGSGTLYWYDSPTGGTQVNTGTTYSTSISATDTFYVENTSGAPAASHTTTFAAGNGSSGNAFTVKALNTITVTSFDGHLSSAAGSPSTWEIWYRPNDYLLSPGSHLSNAGWTQLGTVTTPSAGPGVPTVIPIPLSLTIPAGQTYSFQIFTTTGSVSYTNGTAVGALYNANADLEVYQGHGGTAFAGMVNSPRVWNGIIHYSAGCGSIRTPVIAVVNTPPSVSVTSSNNICGSGSSNLTASSVNPNYGYVWSPAGSLNTPNGPNVVASPTVNTYYLVTGTDPVTGCVDTAGVMVLHAIAPQISVTVSDDTICANTATVLNVVPTFTNPAIVGTGNLVNTGTSYPSPYGNYWWGAKHQMLVTAAELTASGMTAGMITGLSFDVVSPNACPALNNFEIQMALTSLTAMPTTFVTAGMQTVLNPLTFGPPATGINTHTFTTPFYWDGVSNIIVQVCFNNASYVANGNAAMYQTSTTFASTLVYNADIATVCPTATGTTYNQRPNMRFWRTASWDYSWTPVVSLDNPILQSPTATPSISTMYMVDVTDSVSGCVSTDSIWVEVNPNPTPSFGADTVICSNATLLLDGTAGPYDYLWQDNSTNQTFTVNAFGNYSVLVTDSISGCTGTDTILVGINSAPVFTLGSDVTVCQGTQVSFSGPAGQYDYLWNTLDSTVSITTGTQGSYELEVTDTVNGCSAMDTVMLNVNPVPVVDLGSDTSVCSANGSITLSGPAGNFEYLWSTADTTMSITVSSSGNYYVVVTDTATSCYAGDTMFLTYNISPVANLGNDTTFCSANGPITLVAPAGNYSYVWNDMSTGMTLSAATTGLYYVDVLDTVTGCTTVDSIMVNVPMTPSFVLADTSFCGTSFTINGPAGPYDYDWSTLDSTQSITVMTSGSYTLTVTDSTSGCNSSDVSTVNINANPTVGITASDNMVCEDDANVILTGSPAGGSYSGPSVTGNQFDPSIGVGTYLAIYNFTDVNGCSGSDTTSIEVLACVGINEPLAGAGMSIYPNPNTGKFTFFAADQNCAEMTIELTTIEGQVIYTNQYLNVQGNFSQEINVAEFANGVYIMRVTTDGAVYTQRVVKQE